MADDDEFYEPPCRQLLRERHICENCGKKLTLHTLLYRHACDPMEARRERALLQARKVQCPPTLSPQPPAPTPTPARPQTTQKNATLSPQLLAQIVGFGAVRARGRGP